MSDRSAIPAEIRRQVLVEAGHRCAIHTCQHPNVDVHHIIPWDKCRAHEYENLIALCPNCHRRADAGQIDRKALRIYKARLAASFGIAQRPTGSLTPLHKPFAPTGVWRKERIEEQRQDNPPYEFEAEFPVFVGDRSDYSDLSVLQHARALQWLVDFRAAGLSPILLEDESWASTLSSMAISFEISCLSQNLVSIRYAMFHYGAGAAHPNHWTEVSNFHVEPLARLTLARMFRHRTPYRAIISKCCIDEICKQKNLSRPTDWITGGAGEAKVDSLKFNISDAGLLFTFDEYEIDCYAAGGSQVLVPKSALIDLIEPGVGVAQLWQ